MAESSHDRKTVAGTQQKIVLTIGNIDFTQDIINDFRDHFNRYNNGEENGVSIKELNGLLRDCGFILTHNELQDIVNEADQDGSGFVEWEEFLRIIARKMQDADAEEEIKEAFKIFDKAATGFVPCKDLREVLISLGEKLQDEEIDEMIRAADVNGDGQISVEEFVKMMMCK